MRIDRVDLLIAAIVVFVLIDGAYKIAGLYTPGYSVEQLGPNPPACADCKAGIEAYLRTR
ncbi:MAG TPA: hypothetical protein VHA37_01810 [Candidatus Saccharimonadales bacterium]|nr:hypothetical protein [Candidatus Saccharimonadales bacterium]